MSIFRFFELLVFIAWNGVFFFLEYRKRHYAGLNCLKRKGWKKVEQMAIFRPKPWVNPFGKMALFRFFRLFVFIAQKGVFFVLEYRKTHFPGLIRLKKKFEKWPLLDQNHGLTRWEKCQFFDFLNFFFL